MFGGDRFEPLIGRISLAHDMKSALQEADEAEGEGEVVEKKLDAKGKEIISPEEKAKRDEKAKKEAAEVSTRSIHHFEKARLKETESGN